MKPISVRFKCFGPYVAEQFVDFTDMNRIFAISGETGSGKTTILDAMCYALYGSSSSGDRGEFECMRCQQAAATDDTVVEFIFEENGRTYRFGRIYALAKSRFVEKLYCDEQTEDGWRPLAANITKKVLIDEAEKILHLTAAQFRQIIILPQGRFESFLVADSREKENVLESIFEATRWGEIANKVYERVKESERQLLDKERALADILSRYSCANEDELHSAKDAAEEALKVSQAQLIQKKKESADIQIRLEKAVEDNTLFKELDSRKKTLDELEGQRQFREGDAKRLARVDAAQELTDVYETYTAAVKNGLLSAKELQNAQFTLEKAKEALKQANEKQQAHILGEEDHSRRLERKTLLESARPVYETIEQYRAAYMKARGAADTAERAEQAAKTVEEQALKARAGALKIYDESSRTYSDALSAYRRGIAGELATGLRENEPCPVCGSCVHPSPAALAPDHVSKDQLEALEAGLKAKKEKWESAEKNLSDAQKNREEKTRTHSEAKVALASAKAELDAAEKGLTEGIANSAELERQITNLNGQISLYIANKTKLEQAVTDAKAAARSAEDACNKADAVYKEASADRESRTAEWTRSLAESVFADEEEYLSCCMDRAQRDRLASGLTEYKVKLQDAQKRLEEQEALCSGRQRSDIDAIKAEQDATADEVALLDKDCDRQAEHIEALGRDITEYAKQQPKLRVERDAMENNRDFANRLVGAKGVSIKRYVLGIMMTMILKQANSFLANIYGGRYRLHKAVTDAKNKAVGLDLEIEDLQTGDFRSVKSLSGGEKFLVSLSLAIGLSAVVQLQGKGVHMDAMFVDEGFGSLGASAVEDAVSILVQARGGDGIVGVITHVDQVVKSIGCGLEAVKGTNGNTLRRF